MSAYSVEGDVVAVRKGGGRWLVGSCCGSVGQKTRGIEAKAIWIAMLGFVGGGVTVGSRLAKPLVSYSVRRKVADGRRGRGKWRCSFATPGTSGVARVRAVVGVKRLAEGLIRLAEQWRRFGKLVLSRAVLLFAAFLLTRGAQVLLKTPPLFSVPAANAEVITPERVQLYDAYNAPKKSAPERKQRVRTSKRYLQLDHINVLSHLRLLFCTAFPLVVTKTMELTTLF